MNSLTMAAVSLAIGSVVQAAPRSGLPADREVKVFVSNGGEIREKFFTQAQMMASKMFGNIGVRLVWKAGKPRPSDVQSGAVIQIDVHTGHTTAYPDARAFAYPYSNSVPRIVLLFDRLRRDFRAMPNWSIAILAHVFVHEITHVLQGIGRHSDTGVMKAHWTEDDYDEMGRHGLGFTEHDILLIHRAQDAATQRGQGRTSMVPGH